jgi:pimeloyl-ACP methyl ester carboxylesterase
VLAHDLLAVLDALDISQATLAGYDWGGRAACIVAALWPERVRGLASQGGYNIQDISGSQEPTAPETEYRGWSQYHFLAERGRKGLEKNRREFCRLLWRLWSPDWHFDDETYERSAKSFDNPDFVDVVIHSYRHRFGLVAGDPVVQDMEDRLAARPQISVPSVALDGGKQRPSRFTSSRRSPPVFHRKIRTPRDFIGGTHLPQEAPREFADAILSLSSERLTSRSALALWGQLFRSEPVLMLLAPEHFLQLPNSSNIGGTLQPPFARRLLRTIIHRVAAPL